MMGGQKGSTESGQMMQKQGMMGQGNRWPGLFGQPKAFFK